MKITKRQLRRIIKEEKLKLNEAANFNERKARASVVYDGFVDFLESEEIFPMGKIPVPALDAIMKAALTTVDAAMEAPQRSSHLSPASIAFLDRRK